MLEAIGLLVLTGVLWGCTNPFIRQGTKGLRDVTATTVRGQVWAEVTFLLGNWKEFDNKYLNVFTPRRRWWDDLDVFLKNWQEVAQSRERWKEWREAFAQLWDGIGKYVLPWLVNQAGSLSYLAAVQRAPLSVAVPVANSLAFVFTAVTGASVGAEEPLDARSILGIVLIMAGTALCCFDDKS